MSVLHINIPNDVVAKPPPKNRRQLKPGQQTPGQLAAEKEVDANYEFFLKMQPEWLKTNPDDHALLHRKKLIAFYDDEWDAFHAGIKKYGSGNFSVQPVTEEPLYLGAWHDVVFPG